MPPLAKISELIRYLGARLSIALAFALGCGVLIYLDATEAGVDIDLEIQKFLIIAATVVIGLALLSRTVTDVRGKRPSGEQPPPEDRSGE